jgi:hypothetical protein
MRKTRLVRAADRRSRDRAAVPAMPRDSRAVVTMRRLNARWIAAGRRRIVARGLRAEGKTFAQIAAALGVSAEQARRDCK